MRAGRLPNGGVRGFEQRSGTMLIGFLSILIILAVGYAYLREGIFTAFVMLCNVLFSGLIAFAFWEPIADLIDPLLRGVFLQGFEDSVCLMLLFTVTLGLLRLATNNLAPTEMVFASSVYRIGGFIFGMATGYLLTGFLLCVFQTLPWHENFMMFDPRYDPSQPAAAVRRILPPDRVWLGLMYRAGAYPFANKVDTSMESPQTPGERYLTFDKYGTFELRYARYRRYNDTREPLQYLGEFDVEVGRPR